MNLPVWYLRMRKSMNSKIIFWFLKKTHGHSKPQVGTKTRKFEQLFEKMDRENKHANGIKSTYQCRITGKWS